MTGGPTNTNYSHYASSTTVNDGYKDVPPLLGGSSSSLLHSHELKRGYTLPQLPDIFMRTQVPLGMFPYVHLYTRDSYILSSLAAELWMNSWIVVMSTVLLTSLTLHYLN